MTDAMLDEAHAWQARPLESMYPIIYLDALFVSVRDGRTFYDFKQELRALMRLNRLTMRTTKRAIPELPFAIECLKHTPIPTLQTLGVTLESWKDEVGRMWRFTKTNSITEGLPYQDGG